MGYNTAVAKQGKQREREREIYKARERERQAMCVIQCVVTVDTVYYDRRQIDRSR